MDGFLQAIEATSGGLSIQGKGLGQGRLGDNWSVQQRLDPARQGRLECLDVSGDQNLADPSRLRGSPSETQSVHQLNVLVLHPLADSLVTF